MIEASEQGQHFKICLLAWQTDSFSSSIAEGGGGGNNSLKDVPILIRSEFVWDCNGIQIQ